MKMNKTKVLFISTFFSFNALSGLPNQTQLKTIDELQKIKEQHEESVNQVITERIVRNSKQYTPTTFLEIQNSGLEYFAIGEGSSIVNFQDNYQFRAPKGMTVQAYRKPDEGGFLYIKSASGKIQYKVHINAVTNLNKVTQMYEEPDTYVPLEKVESKIVRDKSLIFEHKFGIGFERTASNFTSTALGESRAIEGSVQRYHYTLSTKWSAPINIGAQLFWENTDFAPGLFDSITMRSAGIGILAKANQLSWREHRFEFGAMITFDIQSRLTARYAGGVDRYDLDQNTFQLYGELKINNKLGDFSLGLSYRKLWSSIDDSSQQTSINNINASDSSVGIYIAQSFDQIWQF